MMRALVLLFQVVVGALGLLDKLGQVYHDWQERQKGKVAQLKEDLAVAKLEKANAQVIRTQVADLSDAELDSRLAARRVPDPSQSDR